MTDNALNMSFARWRVWFADASCVAVFVHDGLFSLPAYKASFPSLEDAIQFVEGKKSGPVIEKQVSHYRMVSDEGSGMIVREFDNTYTAWNYSNNSAFSANSLREAHDWLKAAIKNTHDAANVAPETITTTAKVPDPVLEVISAYAREAQKVYENQTSGGDYTWVGLLASCVMAVEELRSTS